MSNEYISSQSNVTYIDIFNLAVAANTNFITTSLPKNCLNLYGNAYVQSGPSSQQTAIFGIYIECSAAAVLSMSRYQISTTQTVTAVWAAEVAQLPNFHSFELSPFEQVNFQMSEACTLNKFVVFEVKLPA
jgi:hypothetical protein